MQLRLSLLCLVAVASPVCGQQNIQRTYPQALSTLMTEPAAAIPPVAEDDIFVSADSLGQLPPLIAGSVGSQIVLPSTQAAPGEHRITVDFPDAPIRRILSTVAELYKLNIVIPDTLVGNASVKLRSVTWQQVFSVVLDPVGFTYVQDGNIIKIKSLEDIGREALSTRIFFVSFANAGDLVSSVNPMIDPKNGGRVQVDKRTNALVITERPSRMTDIQSIITQLDHPTPQVAIESKFLEITGSLNDSLGINWQTLGSTNPNFSIGGTTEEGSLGGPSSVMSWVKRAQTGPISNVVFSAAQFNFVLNALNQDSDTRLVTNPTVVTLNNVEALVSISQRYPIPNFVYNQEQGTYAVTGFNYEDIGVKLKVTPQVNVAGYINLNIRPEVSDSESTVSFQGSNVPVINSRRTESIVTLKDGYTLAIGGLVSSSNTETDNAVPFLGEIPVLGYFFKNTNKTNKDRNLIIFITARTINPDGTGLEGVIDTKLVARMKLQPSDIPGLKGQQAMQAKVDAERARIAYEEAKAREEQARRDLEEQKAQEEALARAIREEEEREAQAERLLKEEQAREEEARRALQQAKADQAAQEAAQRAFEEEQAKVAAAQRAVEEAKAREEALKRALEQQKRWDEEAEEILARQRAKDEAAHQAFLQQQEEAMALAAQPREAEEEEGIIYLDTEDEEEQKLSIEMDNWPTRVVPVLERATPKEDPYASEENPYASDEDEE